MCHWLRNGVLLSPLSNPALSLMVVYSILRILPTAKKTDLRSWDQGFGVEVGVTDSEPLLLTRIFVRLQIF
jgi:hypothetical protein